MLKNLSVLTIVALAAAVLAGCATGPKGPTDEELIREAIAGYTAAAVAKDVDKLMTYVADDFQSGEWADKAAYKAFVQDSMDMGYLDNMEVSTENTEITVEGDKATAAPVELDAEFGSATLKLMFTEEDGKWLISDVTMEMY